MTNINNSHLLNRESDSNKIYIYWKIDIKSFAILIPRYCCTIVISSLPLQSIITFMAIKRVIAKHWTLLLVITPAYNNKCSIWFQQLLIELKWVGFGKPTSTFCLTRYLQFSWKLIILLILLFQAIQLITNGKKPLIYDTIVTLFCSLCWITTKIRHYSKILTKISIKGLWLIKWVIRLH